MQFLRNMRVKPIWIAALILISGIALLVDREFANHRRDVLWDRQTKAVAFVKRDLDGERFLTITNEQKLLELRTAVGFVQQDCYGANSMEGYPSYNMQIIYTDGTTNKFYFNRKEWGLSGTTPTKLLEFLEANGL